MKHTILKEILKKQGLTVTDAAREIGCSRVRLNDIANGAHAGRRLAELIEARFDVPFAALIRGLPEIDQ